MPRPHAVAVATTGAVLLVVSVLYSLFADGGRTRTSSAEPAETAAAASCGPRRGTDREIGSLEQRAREAEAEIKALEQLLGLLETELLSKRAAVGRELARTEAYENQLAAILSDGERNLADAREKLNHSRRTRQAQAEAAERAREKEELDRKLTGFLGEYQKGVVTVASDKGQVGTGLVVGEGAAAQILTSAGAAPYGVKLAVLVRNPSKDEDKFLPAKASVLYRDLQTGLVLLRCEVEESSIADRLSRLPIDSIAEATKGEKVYSISTQILGRSLFENSVFDGTISSTSFRYSRRLHRHRSGSGRTSREVAMLQTTIPANAGSLGSPVIDRRGRLVGVLVGSIPGEERSSVVVPAAEVLRALDRMRSALALSPSGRLRATYECPTADSARIAAAGKAHPVPYREEDSFPLPSDGDPTPTLMPASGGGLLVWIPGGHEITSFKRGRAKPRWTKRASGARDILHRPWSEKALVLCRDMLSERAWRRSFVLDTAAGLERGRLPCSFTELEPIAYYEIDPYWVAVRKEGFSFVHKRTHREYSLEVMKDVVLLGQVGDDVLFFDTEGRLGLFNGRTFADALRRAEGLARRWYEICASRASYVQKRLATRKIESLFAVLGDELRREFTVFEAKGFDPEAWTDRGDGVHVVSTHTVIIRHQLWEIGPKRLRHLGELDPPRHSAGGEEWFFAFLHDGSVGQKRRFDVSVSPDGKYALTETYLFDLSTLQPLVELPFPSVPSGFLSDGRTVYLYDRCNQRVAFMDLEGLLETGRRPWTFGWQGGSAPSARPRRHDGPDMLQ